MQYESHRLQGQVNGKEKHLPRIQVDFFDVLSWLDFDAKVGKQAILSYSKAVINVVRTGWAAARNHLTFHLNMQLYS